MIINRNNYKIVQDQLEITKSRIINERQRNAELIRSLEYRQKEIWVELMDIMRMEEKIGEVKLEVEVECLIKLERNCIECGKVYLKSQSGELLCPECFEKLKDTIDGK